MLLSWDAQDALYQEGFHERLLEDGRTCLLWARGYFFDSSGRMWLDDEIVDWLATQLGANQLSELVPGMNGCFSIVVVWRETREVEVGIDRFGTIPIYYHIDDSHFIISDGFWEIAKRLSSTEYDPDAVLSMVLLGYVAGYRTLLRGIAELPQAATHRFLLADSVPKLSSRQYWMLSHRHGPQKRPEVWREGLAETFDVVLDRYARAISDRGWEPYVPLSGGKDSRLLVGMLTRKNIPVQAFSYGLAGNAETRCASRVADTLGVPFRFVPVNGPSCLSLSLMREMTRRVGMQARLTAGLGGQLSLSAFSEQSVYIPGHTGDFVTGGHLRRGVLLIRSESQATRHIIDIHSLPVLDEMAAALFPRIWDAATKKRAILDGWSFDADDPVGSIDRWDGQNRQRRLILTELRTYEEFGHWILPFYDYELFDFFAQVPLGLRYQQYLYIDALLHSVFVDDLAPLAGIPIAPNRTLQLPTLNWRDWLLLRKPTTVLDDWLLKRATRSKRREHLQSVGARSLEPSGPDPLDHWWDDYPGFRQSVIDTFKDWDGMHGIVDVSALVSLLQKPLPRLFIQFAVPALLTLCYFQQIVERELHGVREE